LRLGYNLQTIIIFYIIKYIYWIGNIELEAFSPKKLRRKVICSAHFEKNDYSNPAAPKSRLKPNVVPKSYLSEGK